MQGSVEAYGLIQEQHICSQLDWFKTHYRAKLASTISLNKRLPTEIYQLFTYNLSLEVGLSRKWLFWVLNQQLNLSLLLPLNKTLYLKPIQPQLHQIPELHPVQRRNQTDKSGTHSPVSVQQFGHWVGQNSQAWGCVVRINWIRLY